MWINLIVYIILVQLWVAGEKAQPSSGHMREKRPIISFRGHEDLSYCIKSGRMSGMLVSGKNFSITKYVMSDGINDIQSPRYHMKRRTFFWPVCGFACTWMTLRARNPSPSGLDNLNPPEHMQRTSARAQTCVRGPGGIPAYHGAESARKNPRPEEKRMPMGQKTFIYIYGYTFE